jgi:hypothetical protein
MSASPLFNKSNFSVGGATESDTYIDYFQRANFWQSAGTNANYHINLTPSTAAALRLTVPAANGKTVTPTGATACGKYGEVDINWLDAQLTGAGFQTAGVTAAGLPLFVLYNVVMYDTTSADCCILGYHSAATSAASATSAAAIQTYAVADFDTTGNFGSTTDISAFSHEIAEWLDDPLGDNPTPAWGNIGEVTGCQSNLEVGDPLAGTIKTIALNSYTWHVQELAFLSWFYHQSPSIGLNGWYSSYGTFKAYANACYTTKTSLSLSPTSIAAGGSTAVNIVVTPNPNTGAPTGKVALVSGATGGTVATYTLSGGQVANANLSGLASGSYTLTAEYAGDGTYSPSDSAAVKVAVGASAVSLNPVAIGFGNQTVGAASAAQTVKLTNGGTAALTGIAISLAGANPGDYSQTNTCGTSVTAGGNCTISVTFKPTAAGLRAATLTIADSASGSPQTVPLSGAGVSAGTATITLSTTSLSFGSVNLAASSAAQSITISNTGSASARPAIALAGANPRDFSLTTTCGFSLAAGSNCKVSVTFTPLATGALSATLTIAGQSVALSGTGVNTGTPTVKLSVSSLAFGSEPEGRQTAAQSVTITNSGTGALSITSVSFTGTSAKDFNGNDNCPQLLAAAASCTVSIRFQPVETGSFTASLSIADNAAGSPQTVALTGTGTAATPTHGHSSPGR